MKKNFKQLFILLSLFVIVFNTSVHAADLRGRLGIGASNQLANELPALSFKIQRYKTFALGGILGFRSNEEATLYGVGVKFYRIIFDEPQLNFYLAGLFASESFLDEQRQVQSGYQVDGTLGTEFHLSLRVSGYLLKWGSLPEMLTRWVVPALKRWEISS